MRLLIRILLLALAASAHAQVAVRDDLGNAVRLAAPAQRIVSLSPHGTELLFAAGAGARVVGTVDHSDYPAQAKDLPHVGSYVALDLERIIALRPDLIVAWSSGNGSAPAQLASRGIAVYVSEPRTFDDIASTVERLGTLAGTTGEASEAARRFRTRLNHLQTQYAQRPAVSVFYQVWHTPLFTLGGPHIFSRVAEVCGGRNIFADLNVLSPTVSLEAVIAANPEAIVASGMGEERPDWLDDWRKWPQLQAVRENHLFFIPPDLLQRATPRLLDGTERLCKALEQVRKDRGQ